MRSHCATGFRSRRQFRCPPSSHCSTPLPQPGARGGVRPPSCRRQKVPALADAPELAERLSSHPGIEFLRPGRQPERCAPRNRGGLRPGGRRSAADGHSRANVGRSSAEATEQIADIVAIAHAGGVTVEVVVATAGLPFDGPTDPTRVVGIVDTACLNGADRIAIADTIGNGDTRAGHVIGRRGPPRIGSRNWARISTTPGDPAWRAPTRRRRGCHPVDSSVGGSVVVRSRRERAATSPPKTSPIYCGTAAWRPGSIWRPRSTPHESPATSWATTCRVRYCAQVTGSVHRD